MNLELDVGPNNLIPSDLKGVPLSPSKMSWFAGGLTVNMEGTNIRASVLIDFGLDTYNLFTISAYPPDYWIYATTEGPWSDTDGVDLGLDEHVGYGKLYQVEDDLDSAYSDESREF